MDTIVVEILRNGQAVNQLLQQGVNYIALCGTEPAKDFTINCDQGTFDNNIQLLRYNTEETARQSGIHFFQTLITGIINQIYPVEIAASLRSDFLHLRLVTTPKEIAQLPFEMALTPVQLQNTTLQRPFFLNPDVKTTFTREVRHIAFKHYDWPFLPRILFAWAQPNNTVPWEDHKNAFIKVLRPWAIPMKASAEPIPDLGSLITIVPDATLTSIKNALTAAINEGKPYTHVHLLAHGKKNKDPAAEQFLLVLNGEANERVHIADGNELTGALVVQTDDKKYIPPIVTLVACDSGNIGSPVSPAGSLAHCLHQSGVPCVFASQFPLTQDGSVALVECLYTQLLQSSDPRAALYDTRSAINTDGTHDWASLVAYARFPEDIDDQMKDMRLKIMLQFMKTSNAVADHVIRNINNIKKEKIESAFHEVSDRLNQSITDLTSLIEQSGKDSINKDRYAEHYGLIGSAYKRKAEHIFRVATYQGNITDAAIQESTEALKKARDWYLKGYRYLNSHWNGTQYLSLAVCLCDTEMGEDENDMWVLCKVMASSDEKYAANDEGKAWAYGTLAELYLLKPYMGNMEAVEQDNCFNKAKDYLQLLNALEKQDFPKESTARQWERYMNWWPAMIKTQQVEQLKSKAGELRKELPELR